MSGFAGGGKGWGCRWPWGGGCVGVAGGRGLPLCAVSVGTFQDALCSLVKADLQGYGIKRLAPV